MKKKTNYTVEAILLVFILAFLGSLIGSCSNQKQYHYDLPEEIQGSNGKDLQVELRNDTFFISFRPEVYNQCYR